MPPIPKFAKVLAKRAKAKPKVISESTVAQPILLGNKSDNQMYLNLINKVNQDTGLDLCHNSDNKNLLETFLKEFFNIYANNKDVKRPTESAIVTLEKVNSAPRLLRFTNLIGSIHKALKQLDQSVLLNKSMTAKIKYIKDVLEVEYYHMINNINPDEKTGKIAVRDYQIKKVVDLPPSKVYATYSSTKDNVNQFTHTDNWVPSVQDIKQGYLRDCYLLSTLLALIESGNTNIIKNCFIKSEGNKVTLRFFKLKVIVKEKVDDYYVYKIIPTDRIEITVNKTILVDPSQQKNIANKTNAAWVNLFEKAFTIYKNTKGCVVSGDIGTYCKSQLFVNSWYSKNKSFPTNSGIVASVQDINNGYGSIAMAAITGKTAKFKEIPYNRNLLGKKFPAYTTQSNTNRYHPNANKLYEMFDKKLKKGNIITVNTRSNDFKKLPTDIKTIWQVTPPPPNTPKNHPSLIPDHAYAMVTSVEEDNDHYKYINLRNPHMNGSVDYSINPQTNKRGRIITPSPEKGKLKMELNDFIKYFGYYEIGKVKKEIPPEI